MIIVNSIVVKYKYNESNAIIPNMVNKKKKVNVINIYSPNILFFYSICLVIVYYLVIIIRTI